MRCGRRPTGGVTGLGLLICDFACTLLHFAEWFSCLISSCMAGFIQRKLPSAELVVKTVLQWWHRVRTTAATPGTPDRSQQNARSVFLHMRQLSALHAEWRAAARCGVVRCAFAEAAFDSAGTRRTPSEAVGRRAYRRLC